MCQAFPENIRDFTDFAQQREDGDLSLHDRMATAVIRVPPCTSNSCGDPLLCHSLTAPDGLLRLLR